MRTIALALLVGVGAAGCGSGPAVTPQIVYVTPEPAAGGTPPATASPTASPTEQPSQPPTEPPTPSPTAAPTATARPSPTASPAPTLGRLPTVGEELATPGSLGITLDEFSERWNDAEGTDDGLQIRPRGWDIGEPTSGMRVAQYYFSDPTDDVYEQFGLVVTLNDDDTVRAASTLYVPSNSELPAFAELVAIFTHAALIDAVLGDVPMQVSNDVLSAVSPPAEDDYSGVEATTSTNGVRFRLTDQGDNGIVFLAREDNMGSAPGVAVPVPLPTAAASSFGDGINVVGDDVQPGTYRIREPASFCYWARLSGFGGDFDEIIANGSAFDGYAVVTIEPSDAGFESNGCGEWSSDLSAVAIPGGEIPNGTLIVGEDIEPGTYRGRGESCYWARLSGFSGELDDIISNGLASSGQTVVTVSASDRGFESSGCTWQR